MLGPLQSWWKHRLWPLWMAAAGVVLMLPTLFVGIDGDDFIHRLKLQNHPLMGEPRSAFWELFRFFPGGEEANYLREGGIMPWWAGDDLRIAFARPLASATHVLDYWLWPDGFMAQHAHSLLWYGLAVGLVGLFYRRVAAGATAAGLATWMFAAEDAHALPVGWLANRNALVPLVFGMVTILLHIRWRERGELRAMAAAMGAFLLALAGGEAALGAMAYLVAWHMTLSQERGLERFRPLAGYAVVVVIWRVLYEAHGFGAHGSGLYVDPGEEPLAFALALAERAPLLLFSQFSQLPVDPWMFLTTEFQVGFSFFCALFCGALGVLFWPLLRTDPHARFWALGMSLSLVPLCASFPMDRLLVFPGIGAFGLLATQVQALGMWGGESPSPLPHPARRFAVGALVFLHAVLVSPWTPLRSSLATTMFKPNRVIADSIRNHPDMVEKTVVWINSIDLGTAYLPVIRAVNGDPIPKSMLQIGSLLAENHVSRLDEDTLEVRPVGGFLARRGDRLSRGIRDPFSVGQVVHRTGVEVEVKEVTSDGRPAVAQFHFDVPLEDPSLYWITLSLEGAREFKVPGIGETVIVPSALPPGL